MLLVSWYLIKLIFCKDNFIDEPYGFIDLVGTNSPRLNWGELKYWTTKRKPTQLTCYFNWRVKKIQKSREFDQTTMEVDGKS